MDVPASHIAKELELKRTSVVFTIFMSVITFGIYMPYWFISRRKAINRLDSDKKISFELPLLVLIFYSFSLIWSIVFNIIFIPEAILEMVVFVDRLLTYFGIGALIFLSFRTRSILMQNDHRSYSGVATFFFTIWYLQYKLNRHFS